jgi:GNAT superfamily N-acetyltransferase
LPRIHLIRHSTHENRLTDPSRVSPDEVRWYLDHAIFLVSEDSEGIQGFVCANGQTGYVWALFVMEGQHGKGHGKALLDSALQRLRALGHRQAFLGTGMGTSAVRFYRAQGWHETGTALSGETVFRTYL